MEKANGTGNLKRASQQKLFDTTPTKRSKTEHTADEPSTSASIKKNKVDLEDDEPKTNLLSLNDDAIFEIFNFLNFDALLAISQQCQRLYDLAESHFNRRYPKKSADLKLKVEEDDILKYLYSPDGASLCFADFPRLTLDYATGKTKKNDMAMLNSFDNIHLLSKINSIFRNVKKNIVHELRFEKWPSLMPLHGQLLKDVVEKAQSVIFSHTIIHDEFYETILKYASSMEQLILWKSFEIHCEEKKENHWLMQRYPNLKRFAWHANQELIISKDLKTFFDQNESIEHFSLLSSNIQTIKQCVQNKIEISDLFFQLKGDVASILKALKKFCGKNTSKRLHLLFEDSCHKELEDNLARLMALEANIDGLYFKKKIISKKLAKSVNNLKNLKILQVRGCDQVKKYLLDLTNLEELYIANPAKSETFKVIRDTMLDLSSRSAKLKKIYFCNSVSASSTYLNIQEFDAERKKLENAEDAEDLIVYVKVQSTSTFYRRVARIGFEFETFRVEKPRPQNVHNPLIDEFIYSNK